MKPPAKDVLSTPATDPDEPREPFLTLLEWKAKALTDPEGACSRRVIKELEAEEVKRVDDDPTGRSSYDFVITTGRRDRDRDTINPLGWKLDNYFKGGEGQVLYAHNREGLPVAKTPFIRPEQDRLIARVSFPSEQEIMRYPAPEALFAGAVDVWIGGGFLKSTSVGMLPEKYLFNDAEGGIDFDEQELLEFSIVPVPSNPEAVRIAAEKGLPLQPFLDWHVRALEGTELVAVERVKLEAVANALDLGSPVKFFDLGAPEFEKAIDEALEVTAEEVELQRFIDREIDVLDEDDFIVVRAPRPSLPLPVEEGDELELTLEITPGAVEIVSQSAVNRGEEDDGKTVDPELERIARLIPTPPKQIDFDPEVLETTIKNGFAPVREQLTRARERLA